MAAPIAPHEMPYRAWVRHMRGLFSPPDFGRMASLGRCTSWNDSSLVSLARSESFPFWSLALNPAVSVGTMNPRIDRSLASPFVFAHTTAMFAVDPLVIHILEPLRSQVPSPCSLAIVIIPLGFEP